MDEYNSSIRALAATRDYAHHFGGWVVVAIPRVIAIVIVFVDIGDTGNVLAVAHAIAKSYNFVCLPGGFMAAHVYHVSESHIRDGNFLRVKVSSQLKLFGHCCVEGMKHIAEDMLALFAALREFTPTAHVVIVVECLLYVVNYFPAVDDVDAIIALVAEVLEGVYADRSCTAEEVADDLSKSGPSVVIRTWSAVALHFAVGE